MKKIDKAVEIIRKFNTYDQLKKFLANFDFDLEWNPLSITENTHLSKIIIDEWCPNFIGLKDNNCSSCKSCEDCWNEEVEE